MSLARKAYSFNSNNNNKTANTYFMDFPTPLISGTLIKRYKRFLTDVTLDSGEMVTAHCANPGAMLGIKDEGLKVWLSTSDNPKRKLKYSWEIVEAKNAENNVGETMVGMNTSHPNKIDGIEERGGKRKPRRHGLSCTKRRCQYIFHCR